MKTLGIAIGAILLVGLASLALHSGTALATREKVYSELIASQSDSMESIPYLRDLMTEDPYSGPPVDGDWLVLRIAGEPGTLNPLFTTSESEFTISQLIYDSAQDYDFNQTVHPGIYKSWTPDETFKKVKISLDSTATWSDGVPITARDFYFTYKTVLRDDIPARLHKDDMEKIEAFDVYDDYNFQLTFKDAEASWETQLDIPLLPKHIYEKEADIQTSKYNQIPICSGPYRVESWETQQRIVLTRNENYRGDVHPHFDRIVFKIIPEESVALNGFMAGQIDYTTLTAEDLVNRPREPQFRDIAKVKVRSTPGYSYIGWNMRNPDGIFADKRVRYAMSHAIDRENIRRYFLYNLSELSNGIFHPEQPFSNQNIKMLDFDPAKSKRLLDEAGWKDTNGDGVRDKNGRPFDFYMLIVSGNAIGENIAQVYQQNLDAIGVKLRIRKVEFATFIDMIRDGTFESYLGAWGGGFFPYTQKNIFHSSMVSAGRNYVGYKSAEADRLLDDAAVEFDNAKRRALYQELQRVVYEDQPYTFLFMANTRSAYNRRIYGIRMSLYGPFRFNPGINGWFVPTDRQVYP